MHVARLGARLLIGGLFVAHGTQKLFGWFGGTGIEDTAAMMKMMQLEPARENAIAAGAAEAGSGALLALGLGTPLAASGIIGVMTTAVRKVHWKNGPWNHVGGYEYNLALCAMAAMLAESGPGNLSLDHLLGMQKKGARWALGAAALGVAASMITVERGRRQAELMAAEEPAAQDAAQPEEAVTSK